MKMPSTSPGQSIFSYSLARPYPVPWFTWVVSIGGLISTVLFSFIALAANGYNSESIYTTDPNATLAQTYWFQKVPFSWASKIKATCQATSLVPGSTYFTTNLGLQYTLARAWQGEKGTASEKVVSAIPYRNAALEACKFDSIIVQFSRSAQTRVPRNRWNWSNTAATATLTCTVHSDSGPLKASLLSSLPPLLEQRGIVNNFISLNLSSHADMWFGAWYTDNWYSKLNEAMGYSAPAPIDDPEGIAGWSGGTLVLNRNSNVTDFADTRFFLITSSFVTDHGVLNALYLNNTIADWTSDTRLPNISLTVDAFGKAYYSLLLTDLGSRDSSNAFRTSRGIKYLQSCNDTYLADAKDDPRGGLAWPIDRTIFPNGVYFMETAYQDVVNDLGREPNLDAPVSRISTQYLCSMPKQKGGASLLFSIVLADLVFLQALWTLLNWSVQWWLAKRDPYMNCCIGCRTEVQREDVVIPAQHSGSQYELLPITTGAESSISK